MNIFDRIDIDECTLKVLSIPVDTLPELEGWVKKNLDVTWQDRINDEHIYAMGQSEFEAWNECFGDEEEMPEEVHQVFIDLDRANFKYIRFEQI